MLKSATSIGANYRAACRARSKREFYSKLCIVVEEADETVYWLELIQEFSRDRNYDVDFISLLKEAKELTAIFTSSKRTTARNLKA